MVSHHSEFSQPDLEETVHLPQDLSSFGKFLNCSEMRINLTNAIKSSGLNISYNITQLTMAKAFVRVKIKWDWGKIK